MRVKYDVRVALRIMFLFLQGCSLLTMAQVSTTPSVAVEDAIRTRSFGEVSPLAFSPDHRLLAYMVRDNQRIPYNRVEGEERSFLRTGVYVRNSGGDIWVSNLETGKTRDLTNANSSNWEPNWSPDGRYLAFLSDHNVNGQARLWVWDSSADQLREISNVNVRENALSRGIVWTSDSRAILITVVPGGLSPEQFENKIFQGTAAAEALITPGATVTVYDAVANLSLGGDTPNSEFFNLDAEYLRDLVFVNVATGKTVTLVHSRRIAWYTTSPDGSAIAYASPKRFDRPGSLRRVYDLNVLELSSGRDQTIASDILLDDAFSWSPIGSQIAYPAYGENEKSFDYYVVSGFGTGKPRNVAHLPYHSYDGRWRMPMWDASGQNFYFVLDGALWKTSLARSETRILARIEHRTIRLRISQSDGQLWSLDGGRSTIVLAHDDLGKQDGFYKVDLVDGKVTRLLEAGQCYSCKFHSTDVRPYVTAVSSDGSELAFIAEDAQRPPDLWVTDAQFNRKRQLTRLNPQFEKYNMGSARLIQWFSDDGKPLQGALLLPSVYDAGTRYPLIVYLYPSIQSDLFDRFGFGEFPGPLNLQLFATRGYAVLLPDAPRQIGEPMASLAKSVLPGVSKVVEMGIADPDRIGVMGHSNGGYSALALIAQTTRFSAAIEADGYGDYVGFYGMMLADGSSYQYGQAEMHLGGSIWSDPQKYIRNSPVFFLDRVQTPLLIVHATDDESVASYLGDEMFVDLRRLGKPVVYARYGNEPHVPEDWSCANQIDLANRSIAWFDSYLKTSNR